MRSSSSPELAALTIHIASRTNLTSPSCSMAAHQLQVVGNLSSLLHLLLLGQDRGQGKGDIDSPQPVCVGKLTSRLTCLLQELALCDQGDMPRTQPSLSSTIYRSTQAGTEEHQGAVVWLHLTGRYETGHRGGTRMSMAADDRLGSDTARLEGSHHAPQFRNATRMPGSWCSAALTGTAHVVRRATPLQPQPACPGPGEPE